MKLGYNEQCNEQTVKLVIGPELIVISKFDCFQLLPKKKKHSTLKNIFISGILFQKRSHVNADILPHRDVINEQPFRLTLCGYVKQRNRIDVTLS